MVFIANVVLSTCFEVQSSSSFSSSSSSSSYFFFMIIIFIVIYVSRCWYFLSQQCHSFQERDRERVNDELRTRTAINLPMNIFSFNIDPFLFSIFLCQQTGLTSVAEIKVGGSKGLGLSGGQVRRCWVV